MSDVATLIADMVRAGVDPELVGRAAAALAQNVQIVQTVQDPVADKRRAYDRERKRNKSTGNPPESAESAEKVSPKKETSPTPPKEKTTPSNSKANAFSARDEKFAEFWIAYPRREGSNPRKPAKATFDRLVAKGVDPQRLIDAAKALAAEHPTPTRFVPQAVTWLNQDRWDDEAPLLSGNEFCPTDWIATRFLVNRFRSENHADPPPAIHGGKSGYMLPAEWVAIAKQRQEPNGTRLEN